jgi:predicted metal-dependent hydrolase
LFAISKLPWIKKQVKSLSEQHREQPREYIEGESIYYQGQRYLVKLQETTGKSEVKLGHKYITILTKPGTTTEQKNKIIKDWYRKKLKEKIPALLDKWEPEIGVKAEECGIKQMRTKWGSCNQSAKRIWLNLELAKKPLICLEYILVHELIHLIERNHNKHFITLMDKHMPKWRQHREELNKLPVARSSWGY